MLRHTKRKSFIKVFYNMRCFVMFVTAVCILFLLKLKSPKNKSFYDSDKDSDKANPEKGRILI